MVEYCFDCGNKIKRGHNKKWNLRLHDLDKGKTPRMKSCGEY